MQTQTKVTAYLKCELLLLFAFNPHDSILDCTVMSWAKPGRGPWGSG